MPKNKSAIHNKELNMTDNTPYMPREDEQPEHTVIKTGKNTYRFTSDWTENQALNSILAGLVADDLMDRDSEKF